MSEQQSPKSNTKHNFGDTGIYQPRDRKQKNEGDTHIEVVAESESLNQNRNEADSKETI